MAGPSIERDLHVSIAETSIIPPLSRHSTRSRWRCDERRCNVQDHRSTFGALQASSQRNCGQQCHQFGVARTPFIMYPFKSIVQWSPCQLPLQNLGARAPNRLFFYYALFLSWKLVFRFYRVLISCFWLYRGPLLGLWTKYHRDGGSDSIGGNILLKKADFVEGVIFFYQIEQARRSLLSRPFIFWILSTTIDDMNVTFFVILEP